ncbi:hypothetical protein AGMMS49928_29600 [Spirochaetia bacterium]|nr:hypothetical protein AGMMS49928_29600 [Spirochaetia bacterium]
MANIILADTMLKRGFVELNDNIHAPSIAQKQRGCKAAGSKNLTTVNSVVTATGPKVRNSDAGPGVNLDAAYSGAIPGDGWE